MACVRDCLRDAKPAWGAVVISAAIVVVGSWIGGGYAVGVVALGGAVVFVLVASVFVLVSCFYKCSRRQNRR
jgi:hypothetical protein